MWRVTAAAAAAVAAIAVALGVYCWQVRHWPAWEAFCRVFVQADGRVIDRTAADRSTSEAQAYSLFFALAANDRASFANILKWTADNLAQGDLEKNLPAWLWGRDASNNWVVLDANSASDADLWLAYTLIEAGRLWQVPDYRRIGMAVLALVADKAVAEIPGFGKMLLPAPLGFHGEDGRWRLNPSYLPEFQLRLLAREDAAGPWQAVWQGHMQAMKQLLKRGIAPDWYQISPTAEVQADTVRPPVGSYDAIRVYMWAGMTAEPAGRDNALMELLRPYSKLLSRYKDPPEIIDFETLGVFGGAPVGFSAAVLPFLLKMDEDSAVKQRQRLKNSRFLGNLGRPPHYYDQALALFGEGWDSERFRFGENGQVIPRWDTTCCDWPF